MHTTPLRAAAAAGALALAGLFGLAAPAYAAGATIVIPDGEASTQEPTVVSGTCAAGSETAVVLVTQGGATLDEQAFDVRGDASYAGRVDLSAGETGPAHASVECLAYGQDAPTSTGAADFFLFDGDGFPEEFELEVTPGRVALGRTVTVSGTCPEGSTGALVQAGLAEADEPFFDEEVTLGGDGSFSVTVPVRGTRTGDAVAFALCFSDSEEDPTAIGFAEFTIVAAPAVPPANPGPDDPAPVVNGPQLANTGSDAAPLTAIAAALVAGGTGLLRLRRRLS